MKRNGVEWNGGGPLRIQPYPLRSVRPAHYARPPTLEGQFFLDSFIAVSEKS